MWCNKFLEIGRVEGKRVLNVKASVVQGQTNENKVIASLKESGYMSELAARYPGLKYSFEGRQREQRKSRHLLLIWLLSARFRIRAEHASYGWDWLTPQG